MENLMRPLVAALILSLSIAAPAAPRTAGDGEQKISVPLTDPGRPATLKVSTINGSITVEGYAAKEVSIETSGRGEEAEGRPRRGAVGGRGRQRRPGRDHEPGARRRHPHPGAVPHLAAPVRGQRRQDPGQ